MQSKRRVRVRRSPEEWARVLKQFESSGVSQIAFCRAEGISQNSLQKWRRRLGSSAGGGFIELIPATKPEHHAPSWQIEVQLPAGVSIRFTS